MRVEPNQPERQRKPGNQAVVRYTVERTGKVDAASVHGTGTFIRQVAAAGVEPR